MRWGTFRVSYTYSKALDDVSEFFFSAPLNNFNVHQDWGRSDDDQRHRLVFDTTLHSSMDRRHTPWQRISHGFQLNGILTYYSALPFNIVTGANTIQTTAGRPCVGLAGNAAACTNNVGLMIGRNTGTGFDSFNLNTRLSRKFAIGERFRLEAIAELFNALNHTTTKYRTTRSARVCIRPILRPPSVSPPPLEARAPPELALRVSF